MTMSALAWSRGLIACALLATSASISFAQNANQIFDRLIKTVIIEAAKAQWRKVPPPELACIEEQSLKQQGTSTANLAQQGIVTTQVLLDSLRKTQGFGEV
jgi:hypothetical protein